MRDRYRSDLPVRPSRCPYCGGRVSACRVYLDDPRWCVTCDGCLSEGHRHETPEAAIEQWERRCARR